MKAAAAHGHREGKSNFIVFISTFLPSCQLSCCCRVHLCAEAVVTQAEEPARGFNNKKNKINKVK